MAICPIRFSEGGRRRLGIVCALVNGIAMIGAIGMIICGIYIKIRMDSRLMLLNNYNGDLLPKLLCSVGALTFLFNAIEGRMCYGCGSWRTRDRFQNMLLISMIFMSVLNVVVFSTAMVVHAQRGFLKQALHQGFGKSMQRYKDVQLVKTYIDLMQMNEKCCGSTSYRDWFTHSWISTTYLNVENEEVRRHIRDFNFYAESVPFSCCDTAAIRPCVHHDVTSRTAHRNYDPDEHLTIYTTGCIEALSKNLDNYVLWPTFELILCVFGIEWFVIILTRYMQTTCDNATLRGDTQCVASGYLFKHMPCSCVEELLPTKQTFSEQNVYRKGELPPAFQTTSERKKPPPPVANDFDDSCSFGSFEDTPPRVNPEPYNLQAGAYANQPQQRQESSSDSEPEHHQPDLDEPEEREKQPKMKKNKDKKEKKQKQKQKKEKQRQKKQKQKQKKQKQKQKKQKRKQKKQKQKQKRQKQKQKKQKQKAKAPKSKGMKGVKGKGQMKGKAKGMRKGVAKRGATRAKGKFTGGKKGNKGAKAAKRGKK